MVDTGNEQTAVLADDASHRVDDVQSSRPQRSPAVNAREAADVVDDVDADLVHEVARRHAVTAASASARVVPATAHSAIRPAASAALTGGSVANWLVCWTQAQKGLGSNRSRDAVG